MCQGMPSKVVAIYKSNSPVLYCTTQCESLVFEICIMLPSLKDFLKFNALPYINIWSIYVLLVKLSE